MAEGAPQYSLDKSKIKVLLLESIDASALSALHAAGYSNVVTKRSALPEAELAAEIRDVHLLGIRSRTRVRDQVLAQATKLIAIGCFCIGTDQVDLAAAGARGIPVFNAPFSNTRSVAELVLAEGADGRIKTRLIPRQTRDDIRTIYGYSESMLPLLEDLKARNGRD